ncbi:MAG: hypothetical protein EOO63_17765, partial [Hymenobacter sp.]
MKRLSTLWISCLTTLAALSAQGQAASTSTPMTTPPIATVKPKPLTSPHGTRTDNYYWLNE